MDDAPNPASLLIDILKALLTVSLAFIAGFLAFLGSVTPRPSLEWATTMCLIGLAACSLSSLTGVFWGAIILIRQEDILNDLPFFFLVILALVAFAVGMTGGVVAVFDWL